MQNPSGFGRRNDKKNDLMRKKRGGKRCFVSTFHITHSACSVLSHISHITHTDTHTNHLHPLKISHAHQAENAMSICAESMKQRVIFEALLKAITIGVESTHDNWFASSK